MDNDTLALQIAGAAVTAVDVAYRNADTVAQIELQEVRNQLWTAYAVARNRLLAAGVIVSDAQLEQMSQLHTDLAGAADQMAFASAAVKLAGILTRIALV